MLVKIIKGKKCIGSKKFSTLLRSELNSQLENPTIEAILSKGRIERHNKEIEFELAHSDRREQLLQKECDGKLGLNSWNIAFKPNSVAYTEGFKETQIKLNDKIDFKNRCKVEHSYDYPVFFHSSLKELNNAEMWNIEKVKNELFDNNIRNGFEYIDIMMRAEEKLLQEENQPLAENEIKIVNLPLDCSIKELKKLLGIKANQISAIKRDQLNNVSNIVVRLENAEKAKKFIKDFGNTQYKANKLKFITSASEAVEKLSQRTIVLDNLDSSVSEKELLLELGKVVKVNQIILPEVLHYGNVLKTSDVLKYIEAKKHTFEDDAKIEIIEKDGDNERTFTAYENPRNLNADIYLNKTQGLNYIKSFTMETFEEIKKLDEEESLRRLLREKNKIVIHTVKDDDSTATSTDSTQTGNKKSELSDKMWGKFNDNEKLMKVRNRLKNHKHHYKMYKLLSRNDDRVTGPTSGAGFAILEFSSSFEAKKALVALKSLPRFSQTKVDLWSPGKLPKLVPELKAKMIETIEQNKMMNAIFSNTPKLDVNLELQGQENKAENHSETVRFLRKQQLKESLKSAIDNFIQKTYYTDSPNLETKLPGLDELSHHMLKEGRSFGESYSEQEYEILKARVGLAYKNGSYKAEAIDKIKFLFSLQSVS